MSIPVPNLSIEITRRCNLRCEFCIRGEIENKDIPHEYIDSLFDQVALVDYLCITGGEPSLNTGTIQYIADEIKRRGIFVKEFCIATNGLNASSHFVKACKSLYRECFKGGRVVISNDSYHYRLTDATRYKKSLLRSMSFCKRDLPEDGWELTPYDVHREGRYKKNSWAKKKSGAEPVTSIEVFERNPIYLNVNGHIINGCDWSYENQEKHRLCKVENLEKFYNAMKTNDDFVEEDWERAKEMDKMFLYEEMYRAEQEEFERWIAEQETDRQPAEIKIMKPKQENYEDDINAIPFSGNN